MALLYTAENDHHPYIYFSFISIVPRLDSLDNISDVFIVYEQYRKDELMKLLDCKRVVCEQNILRSYCVSSQIEPDLSLEFIPISCRNINGKSLRDRIKKTG